MSGDRVVELRVHGVSGTSPEDMLDDPWPQQVAGDDVARFLRPRLPSPTRARTLEALHWGRFTSGSPTRALWLLLAPFALLNLAHYALLPPGPDRGPRAVAAVARGLIRLLGLALTMTLALSVATASLDLVMNQCAGAPRCVAGSPWLKPVAFESEGARFAIGVVPPLLIVVLLWWFGRQTFLHGPPERKEYGERPSDWGDPLFWRARLLTDLLRDAHVAACCAVLALLFLGFLDQPRSGGLVLPLSVRAASAAVAVAVLTICAAIAARPRLRPPPTTAPPATVPPGPAPSRWLKWLAVGHLGLVVLGCAGSTWTARPTPREAVAEGTPLPGFEWAGILVNLVLAALVAALFVACLLLGGGRSATGTPRPFRPLWKGFGALVIASLAATLATGASSGVTFWAARLLGTPLGDAGTAGPPAGGWGIQLGASWWVGAMLWGWTTVAFLLLLPGLAALVLRLPRRVPVLLFAAAAAAGTAVLVGPAVPGPVPVLAVGAAVLAVAGAGAWWRAWRTDGLADQVRDGYPGVTAEDYAEETFRKIAMSWRLARGKYRAHWVLGTVAGLSMLTTTAYALVVVVPSTTARYSVPSGAFGATVISFLAAVSIALGLRSWRNQKVRIAVGILWDLLAFWPRVAHPLCPPPYGGRTTLELVERVNHLAHREGAEAVILSGHSQGSLVCLAAMAVLERESRTDDAGTDLIPRAEALETLPRTCLVTYGSQLQWAYARLFPAHVGHRSLAELHGSGLQRRWRNLYRWTDPLGGPVLTWPDPAGPGGGSPEPPRAATARLALPDGCPAHPGDQDTDVRLDDPASVARSPARPRSPLRGHGGYYEDPRFDRVVDELAATVRRPPPESAPPAPMPVNGSAAPS